MDGAKWSRVRGMRYAVTCRRHHYGRGPWWLAASGGGREKRHRNAHKTRSWVFIISVGYPDCDEIWRFYPRGSNSWLRAIGMNITRYTTDAYQALTHPRVQSGVQVREPDIRLGSCRRTTQAHIPTKRARKHTQTDTNTLTHKWVSTPCASGFTLCASMFNKTDRTQFISRSNLEIWVIQRSNLAIFGDLGGFSEWPFTYLNGWCLVCKVLLWLIIHTLRLMRMESWPNMPLMWLVQIWQKCFSVTGSLRGKAALSATHRQTGWGLHQRWWSNDASATPQQRPRHELAWIWTDFFTNSVGRPISSRQ